jgi:hypothetical protein
MVIDDLNIRGTGSPSQPVKADPPLVIDANTVLALSIPLQGFESVARQGSKIPELDSRLQAIKLKPGGPLNSREGFDSFTGCEVSGALVPVADDHFFRNSRRYVLRQA